MSKCKIIYIEGPDYSGKTTLISKLRKKLEREGNSVFITREPGGNNGEKIREILLDPSDKISYITRRLLFLANHIETMDYITYISEIYDYIIIDRSAEISDMVYGHMCSSGRVKPISRKLYKLMGYICSLAKEDFYNGSLDESRVVFLDTPINVLRARISKRENTNDLNDNKSTEFKLDIAKKYKVVMNEWSEKYPENTIIHNPVDDDLDSLIYKINK
ncbi:MAG: dTMP kinase [Paraclostridium sp.]